LDFIKAMRAQNRLVAMGHSSAGHAVVAAAAEAGATLSTHLGNGLPQVLPKLDNTLFAQLAEDRLLATFIADGIHVPPHALKALIRAKGIERSALVTDAVAAAGAGAGIYGFAGMRIERSSEGVVSQAGMEGLAGSALRLDEAVRNLVRWNIASFGEAIDMASTRLLDLLVPILDVHHVALPASEVEWSRSMTVRRVRLGDEAFIFEA
ncbi:MAG: N-acetylglucosamine-6-phosphate deacetylase, partial [Phyllobacterium sp.]